MDRRGGRKGNAAVTGLMLAGALAFGALGVDVAYVQVVNAQLGFAVEAGALGGSAYLDGTVDGVALAKQRAVELAAMNPIVGGYTIGEDDVEVGRWTEQGGFELVATIDEASAKQVNAMRIQARHDGLQAVLAGAAFGRNTHSTGARAMAVREVGGPAGAVECFLPLALPDCAFPANPTVNPAPIVMKFNAQNDKNIGWAHPDGANAANVKSHFDNPGLCATGMGIGDWLPVSNGTLDVAGEKITDILNGKGAFEPLSWPDEHFAGPPDPRDESHYAFTNSSIEPNAWGNVIGGPIALVDMGGGQGGCAETGQAPQKFNQTRKITGFVWGYIYDRKDAGGANAHLYVQVDFLNERKLGTEADPDAIGTILAPDSPPRLVRY